MSDSSSIPSIQQQNEGNESEPYSGGSSASSLGAPAPESSDPAMDGPATDDLEGTDRDVVDGDVNDSEEDKDAT